MNQPKTFAACTSQAAQLAFVQDKLANDQRWLARGWIAIYNNQTADEQRRKDVENHNGIGFKVQDAQYLSDVLQVALRKGMADALMRTDVDFQLTRFISEKQAARVTRMMQKYARQLCKEAREKLAQKKQKQVAEQV